MVCVAYTASLPVKAVLPSVPVTETVAVLVVDVVDVVLALVVVFVFPMAVPVVLVDTVLPLVPVGAVLLFGALELPQAASAVASKRLKDRRIVEKHCMNNSSKVWRAPCATIQAYISPQVTAVFWLRMWSI
jgi:hypothetical protein